jgi:hypothetical protein
VLQLYECMECCMLLNRIQQQAGTWVVLVVNWQPVRDKDAGTHMPL